MQNESNMNSILKESSVPSLLNLNGGQPSNMPFWNEIVCGDSSKLLKEVPDNSIDLVITSPPYFQQREYPGGGIGNEKHPDEYISALIEVFRECVRIIKPTGSIVFNIGDKYENSNLLLMPYRFAIAATEQCGVMLVNNTIWVKSNPVPRQFKRRLVSSTEPFFHFVKSQDYQYYMDKFSNQQSCKKANNKHSSGTSDNIGKKYYELIEASQLTFEQKAKASAALKQVIEEVKNGELQSFRMKIRGIHAEPFGGQDGGRKIQLDKNGFTIIRIYGNPIKRDVIIAPVESIKNCPHPAIYPVQIIRELLQLLTLPGDIILDPFIGSGSTAVASLELNRNYIGFDISDEYCQYARERLKNVKYQLNFFEYE